MLLRSLIVILALTDGVLHLWLNWLLFRGNVWGPLPFPSPFLLPLNQLFTLNFIFYVILAVAFWFGPRLLGPRRWLIDVALIVLALLSIIGWAQSGLPNPRGLGYLSKAIEVVLIVLLGIHMRSVMRVQTLSTS